MQVALGQPHGADVEARADPRPDELGRAAAEVDHERVGAADAAPGQLRLLLAREQARPEPVASLDLVQELLAVFGVADGARRDEQDARRVELARDQPIVGERLPRARERGGEKAPTLVDALAEPDDPGLPVELIEAAGVDVGHEQAHRVRAQVDRRDADHLCG